MAIAGGRLPIGGGLAMHCRLHLAFETYKGNPVPVQGARNPLSIRVGYRGRLQVAPFQFPEGRSMWSTMSTSTGPLPDFNSKPSVSRTAVTSGGGLSGLSVAARSSDHRSSKSNVVLGSTCPKDRSLQAAGIYQSSGSLYPALGYNSWPTHPMFLPYPKIRM